MAPTHIRQVKPDIGIVLAADDRFGAIHLDRAPTGSQQ
jgi:hypothetical protein